MANDMRYGGRNVNDRSRHRHFLGCAASDTMFQAAKKLALVNRFFHP
jgi:hypothetical protein